ncbi:LysR family transcriptional regulator [Pseudomonas typographi]|uniref:LysR family transcriptional regulator n=1 Tax=Pseudomonas typographi TaxID=2715964 RepID=A0ABR7Z3L4_9PSED|nr:LysR family transcriptional regulator [Pseudomonas typographi]MBD1550121.1 LysR family transcriptional regulator [Pseudomonas typographi]MBD1586119.1 LysR family transcriptional regulator [Pseudomonas typographi]MBD1599977.1 LysR family transcriptional regulator [Pseudomonas typographi]
MDIKQLRFLIALDETRHFGQAAARCHITQPTLSMRLRNLEEELELPLVVRGQRFEGFTAPGERVLAWARTVLAAYDGLQAEAAACRGHLVGTLRLGVVPLSSFDPVPLLSGLHALHPELRFELSALSSEQIFEHLASNQIDLGVSFLDKLDRERFEALPLCQTRLGLLYDERHFDFGDSSLSWEAVAQLPLGMLTTGMHFRQSIDHAFHSRGLAPKPLIQTDAVHQLLQAVHGGLCCAIMPLDGGLEALTEHLRLQPLAQAHTLASLGLIMRRSAPRSALAEACFAFCQSTLE